MDTPAKRSTGSKGAGLVALQTNCAWLWVIVLLVSVACSGEQSVEAKRPDRAAESPSLAAGATADLFSSSGQKNSGGEIGRTKADRIPQAGVWTEALRAIVTESIRKADKNSKGKANASNIGIGLQVIDLASGVILAQIRADHPRRPASNLKLVTTASALVLFGVEAEFLTSLEASGEIADGRLFGNLVVRASGDPIVNRDSDPHLGDRFRRVAAQVKQAGIDVIEGNLVLDEGTFQVPAPGPAWPDPSQYWQEYCALSGGFSVNGGVLVAEVTATRPGSAARVEVQPVPHGLRSILRPMTIAKGPMTLGGEARQGRVLVQGNVKPRAEPYLVEFSHPDPVAHFGAMLTWALEREGVELRGEVVRKRNCSGGAEITSLRSPIVDTLYPINAESRNGVADQLFLAIGHASGFGGTRRGGQQATQLALRQLGVSIAGLRQVDGSGLSFDNAIAPAQIAALLAAAMDLGQTARNSFLSSLAVAGSVGTLEKRMIGTSAAGRVRAKSGWIRGTSALSGIAQSLQGRDLVFSFLIEYPPKISGLNRSVFKPLTDKLCVYLVEQPLTLTGTQEAIR